MNNTIDELQYLHIQTNQSSIKIALQGAHIFDFKVQGKKSLLYLSKTARFEKGFPIRGGVPICWPWFGPHSHDTCLPNHGFARISLWEHVKTEVLSEDKTKITLRLNSSNKTLSLWPFEFSLSYEIYISDILELHLISKNTGDKDFVFSQALHTYLNIDDISTTKLKGLENTNFYNKVDDTYNNIQEGPVSFKEEVDRVYEGVHNTLKIQNIKVETLGSNTVVIWNPGKELTQKMPDLSSYTDMLCIESASTLKDEITLKSGQTHRLTSIITQE
ncbi:D-hexose-6-phosphate mutarotase [Sulfurimonas sp. MAG313]|nr:D-hexose-6-phosphate mutarotase [Sulfurimonas sp. MAG313]MDF1880531.1 D-hexose-6-phosphate mutarotase [Sulfurimonas sp. MAG313]